MVRIRQSAGKGETVG